MKTKIRAVANLMVVAVIVALAIGSIPAREQTVTTTVAAGTSPARWWPFFYGGNSSCEEIAQRAPSDFKSDVTWPSNLAGSVPAWCRAWRDLRR